MTPVAFAKAVPVQVGEVVVDGFEGGETVQAPGAYGLAVGAGFVVTVAAR
jgi:hypothetical protein